MSDHPFDQYEIKYEGTLSGALAKTLVEYSDGCNCEPIVLLADIIETVLREDLIAAVLDR